MKAISIEDKLPEFDEMVLLIDAETNSPKLTVDCGYLKSIDKDGPNFIQNIDIGDLYNILSGSNKLRKFKVTHWIKLNIEL